MKVNIFPETATSQFPINFYHSSSILLCHVSLSKPLASISELTLTMDEAGTSSLKVRQARACLSTGADEHSSMLFKILPTAVQTRIPQLPSLRKSASTCNVTDQQHNSASQARWSQSLAVGFVEEASVTSSPGLSRQPSSRSSVEFPSSAEVCRESTPSREWRYATNGSVTEIQKLLRTVAKGVLRH